MAAKKIARKKTRTTKETSSRRQESHDEGPHKMTPEWEPVHKKLSAICAALPDTSEVIAWGHPNWKVGRGSKARMFAGWGAGEGMASLGVMTDPFERKVLLNDERITVAKYVGHKGWVSFRMDDPKKVDWNLVERLLRTSHAVITGKIPS